MPKRRSVLRILAGPDAGKEVVLTAEEIVLGRGSKSAVPLSDSLLSRQHARLFKAVDGWYVDDMRSTNGTWIAGQAVKMPTRLEPGDEVRIGKTVFEVTEPLVEGSPSDEIFDQTMISYRLDPVSVESLTIATDGQEGQMRREQEKLAAIYEVQGLLSDQLPEQELFERILATMSKVIPNDVAFLLAYLPEEESLDPVARRQSGLDLGVDPVALISRSMVNFVRDHKQAVLSSDPLDDSRMNQTYVSGMNMTSIMCVPLLSRGDLLGMIYLLSMQGNQIFQRDDLKLASAIAQSAALAIQNTRLIARNLQQERMAAIGMTAAGLSHCVKNILTGLEGSVSLLRMGIDSDNHDTMNAAWGILNTNHRRLSSLMLDLLSLSKEVKLYFAEHNVADILLEVVELARNQTHEDKITVDLDPVVTEAPLIAKVDSRGIHRVVLNLITNAIDSVRQHHGQSGKGRIAVSGRFEDEGETLIIEVSDNGVGIPEDELERVFEPMHSTKGERGTGLGLAVSKRIIDGHRGRMMVRSKVGEETTFTVRMPTRASVATTQFIRRSNPGLRRPANGPARSE